MSWHALIEQPLLHAFAQNDDGICSVMDIAGQQRRDADEVREGREEADARRDIGIDVHFPNNVASSPQALEQSAHQRNKRRPRQRDDSIHVAHAHRVGEGSSEECCVRGNALPDAFSEVTILNANDFHVRRRRLACGISRVVGRPADHGNGIGRQGPREVRQILAGGCRIRVEKLI